MRYITSELEEIEREDNFRLKRFKELKYKNKKGDDNTNKRCYCKKQPEKGDDFVCFVCKQEEERKKKKSPCVVTIEPGVEVIGDKASSFSTVNKKRLDDLNAHLEKVISLTCQCKFDGLVSQSVDRLIYACEEVRCKLETDQKQTAVDEQDSQSCCNSCKDEVQVTKSEETPPQTCQPEEKQDEKEEDSLGYFETKFKETVKVMKFKNEDGTISEERQVVTVKTEKKHPHKPNEFGVSPCCKVQQISSITSDDDNHDGKSKHPKETKSEEIPCCVDKEQTTARSCVSDSGTREKKMKESDDSSKVKSKKSLALDCCKVCDAATEPEPPSPVCCRKKSPSETLNKKSSVCVKSCNKSLKEEPTKKDVACECKTEVKTVCCDSMWKDVATSSTGLAESSEEEELSLCVEASEKIEPANEADKESIDQKSTKISIKISYDKGSDEDEKKKSSQICSICSQCSSVMRDTSTTTSNIVLERRDKPSSNKTPSCLSSPPETKKSSPKINKRSTPCCNDTKSDDKPKTCCKIRIVSNKIGSKEKNVQEFIFFGNIMDAVKRILAPSKSDESFMKTRESKETNGTKTCKNANSLSKKSSLKSVCKSCESKKVPSKSIERSQSCPQCSEKGVGKSISWSYPRSKSADNAKGTPKSCSCAPRVDVASMCSVCGSEFAKDAKSNTSDKSEEDECLSCEIESCPQSRTSMSSAIDYNDQDSGCVCHPKKPPIKPSELKCKICYRDKHAKPSKPKCKICHPEKDPCSCHPKDQKQGPPKKIEAVESKCKVCNRNKTQCECHPKNTKVDKKSSKSKCKTCQPDKPQHACCPPKNEEDKPIEPPKPKCKICYPEEDPCNCHSKDQNQEPPKKTEASELICEVCNRNKAQCECYPKDTKVETKASKSKCKTCQPDKPQHTCCPPKNEEDKPIEPPKPKCKICYPEEDPCNCHSKDQNQEPPKKTEASELICEVCNRNKAQCECYPNNTKVDKKSSKSKCKTCQPDKPQHTCCPPKNEEYKPIEPPKPKCKTCYPEEDPCKCHSKDQNQEPPKKTEAADLKCDVCNLQMETKSSKSKCKICFSDENQTTKSVQTGTPCCKPEDAKKPNGLCPICSTDQVPTIGSVPQTKSSKSLCCDTSRMDKDEIDCKKCVGVETKDASTSTRRSDRYDVRPLNLLKPGKKLTCTCHSDSYLTTKPDKPPKRCSSCHADYYK